MQYKIFADSNLPKEEIGQKRKAGVPPPSPRSFVSSDKLENCTSGLLLVPLRKHLMDLLVLTM